MASGAAGAGAEPLARRLLLRRAAACALTPMLALAGIQDAIAIEFDTYQNKEFGDVNDLHVAVHTGGCRQDNAADSSTLLAHYGSLRTTDRYLQDGASSLLPPRPPPNLRPTCFCAGAHAAGWHTRLARAATPLARMTSPSTVFAAAAFGMARQRASVSACGYCTSS